VSQGQRKPSSMTFQESIRYSKAFIAKMRDSNGRLREGENTLLADAVTTGDQRLQHATGTAIMCLQNADALYMLVDWLLDVLEAQSIVNQELLGHIKNVAGKRVDLTPAIIGEIVKSGFDQLAKESEERTRKLAGSAYA